MEAAQFANQFGAGTKIQMVGVGEDDLSAEGFEGLLRQPFNRAERADGHERRRVNDAVRSLQAAKARAGWVGRQNFKAKRHSPSVSGRQRSNAYLHQNVDHPDEGDPGEPFAKGDFFRAHNRICEGHQSEHPKAKQVERSAES